MSPTSITSSRKGILAGTTLFAAALICTITTTGWSFQNKATTTVSAKPAMEVFTEPIPERAEDISPLLIGESIPDITLPDATGKSFDLNKAVAESPTILVFYRGGWCPYCTRQLSGLQEIEQDLKKAGYKIVAISTDSPENLAKTLGKDKLSYTLLSDNDLTVAKKFGIAFKAPKAYDKLLPEASGGNNVDKLLPVASVFFLDTKGKIEFEYINPNYAERISPTLLKAAANALAQDRSAKK